MFSAPLFKQSIRANWISWLVVAVATCFMLTLILAVVGSDTVNNVMNSMGNSFARDAIECQVEETSMNYYYMAATSLEGFMEQGEEAVLANTPQEYKEFVSGAIHGYLQSDLPANEFASIYAASAVTAFMTQPLLEYGFLEEEIGDIAYDAIINFRAQTGVKFPQTALSQIDPEKIGELIEKLTLSTMDGFPQEVKDNINEMQTLDITQLMTGSVFYKITGLLLAVIYIIMVSNSLISGQVDSGSMAYVLSTPTKRRAVSFTQMAFMLVSVLGICVLTTATGIFALLIIGSASINYAEIILLNVGYFFTLFSFSGICFFASSWFNRSRHSLALGGGLSMYFIVSTILGLFGSSAMPGLVRMESMNIFNFTTITCLFDTESILSGTTDFIPKLVVLFLIGLVGFVVGIIKFNKKDLPL